MGVIDAEGTKNKNSHVLIVCQNGYGKRVKLAQYRLQNRGGSGVITCKITKKTGPVVSSRIIDQDASDLILTSTQGQVIRMPIKNISVIGRPAQGVRLMRLGEGETVAAATVLEPEAAI